MAMIENSSSRSSSPSDALAHSFVQMPSSPSPSPAVGIAPPVHRHTGNGPTVRCVVTPRRSETLNQAKGSKREPHAEQSERSVQTLHMSTWISPVRKRRHPDTPNAPQLLSNEESAHAGEPERASCPEVICPSGPAHDRNPLTGKRGGTEDSSLKAPLSPCNVIGQQSANPSKGSMSPIPAPLKKRIKFGPVLGYSLCGQEERPAAVRRKLTFPDDSSSSDTDYETGHAFQASMHTTDHHRRRYSRQNGSDDSDDQDSYDEPVFETPQKKRKVYFVCILCLSTQIDF